MYFAVLFHINSGAKIAFATAARSAEPAALPFPLELANRRDVHAGERPAAYNSHLCEHGQTVEYQFSLFQDGRTRGCIARAHARRGRKAALEPSAWSKDAGEDRAAKLHPWGSARRAGGPVEARQEETFLIELETPRPYHDQVTPKRASASILAT